MTPTPRPSSEVWQLASDQPETTTVDAGARRVRPLLAAGGVLLVCDFDGTLARRQADSWAARILPQAQRALRRLAGSNAVSVAFLSGRAAGDLAERTRVGRALYLGDHGAERARAVRGFRPGSMMVSTTDVSAEALTTAADLAVRVPRIVAAAWLAVEHKHAGVAFHFRRSPDIDDARSRVTAAVDMVDPRRILDRIVNARSLELRAPGAPSKASTLAALIARERPRSVIALGDDRNDAEAWLAMRLAADETHIETAAIAVASLPDVTAAIAPRADIVLDSPDVAAALLGRMARFVHEAD